MAEFRVTVGGGGDYPGTVPGIKDALDDGHKWLLIQEPEITWSQTLDLKPYAGRFIRLEGSLPYRGGITPSGTVTLRRTFSTGPMIKSAGANSSQHLFLSGLSFVDNATGSYPFIEIQILDRSRFLRCAFIGSFWNAIELAADGSNRAATSEFEQCIFRNNRRSGCGAAGTVDIGFNQCVFENNGLSATTSMPFAGLYYQGPPSGNESYRARGLGVVKNCFFRQTENKGPAKGLLVVNARGMDILRNTFDGCDLWLQNDTSHCFMHRNRKANGASIVNSGSSSTEQATVTLS